MNQLRDNPLEVIELLAHRQPWHYERRTHDVLHLFLDGDWGADYDFALHWNEAMSCLHLTAIFSTKRNRAKREDIHCLLSHINARLWFGFFCLAKNDNGESHILFRHSHLFTDGVSQSLCQNLIEIARAALDEWAASFYLLSQGARLGDALAAHEKRRAA